MIKIQIIDKDKKKDAQVLHDLSLTPSQRFVRMFDLIKFCITFSKSDITPLSNSDYHVINRKKKVA
jgi:hypothetical protein